MILVDATLLLYARHASSPHHDPARSWLDQRLAGSAPVGLPWHSLLAFVRLASDQRAFRPPLAVDEAWRQVEDWLNCDAAWIPQPTDRHRDVLGGLLRGEAGSARLVSEAHLAALAIEHGLILCSADGDFARFRTLRWENPLRA